MVMVALAVMLLFTPKGDVVPVYYHTLAACESAAQELMDNVGVAALCYDLGSKQQGI